MYSHTGRLAIGIDTSGYGELVCVLVARDAEALRLFVSRVEKRLAAEGYRGDLHWRRIRTATRKKVLQDIAGYLKEARSRGVVAYIFRCKRREGVDKRFFFLRLLPMRISDRLIDDVRGMGSGRVCVTSDRDFDSLVPDVGDATSEFLDRLLSNLASRIACAEVRPKAGRELVANVVVPGAQVTIVGVKRRHDYHIELKAADVVLGLYNDSLKRGRRLDGVILETVG